MVTQHVVGLGAPISLARMSDISKPRIVIQIPPKKTFFRFCVMAKMEGAEISDSL
jgi:hypothetical protein